MHTQFWLDKWDKQEIGFHMEAVHPLLQKFYPRLITDSQGVFVPLCGRSNDLTFLAGRNRYTLGCELSKKAVESFFIENKLTPTVTLRDGITSYQHKVIRNSNFDCEFTELEILVGDFFDLQAEQVRYCQAIYDRAALIALPFEMRQEYVLHMRRLFTRASLLLIALDYPEHQMQGPPFSVKEHEVNELFRFARVETVYSQNIIEKEPKFKTRGLEHLFETAYLIRW